jgi:hypothetical protein
MKSFLADRPSAAIPPLRPLVRPLEVLPCPEGAPRPAHSHSGGAVVECIREGEKVVRLVVTCTCGERIDVECIYSVGA